MKRKPTQKLNKTSLIKKQKTTDQCDENTGKSTEITLDNTKHSVEGDLFETLLSNLKYETSRTFIKNNFVCPTDQRTILPFKQFHHEDNCPNYWAAIDPFTDVSITANNGYANFSWANSIGPNGDSNFNVRSPTLDVNFAQVDNYGDFNFDKKKDTSKWPPTIDRAKFTVVCNSKISDDTGHLDGDGVIMDECLEKTPFGYINHETQSFALWYMIMYVRGIEFVAGRQDVDMCLSNGGQTEPGLWGSAIMHYVKRHRNEFNKIEAEEMENEAARMIDMASKKPKGKSTNFGMDARRNNVAKIILSRKRNLVLADLFSSAIPPIKYLKDSEDRDLYGTESIKFVTKVFTIPRGSEVGQYIGFDEKDKQKYMETIRSSFPKGCIRKTLNWRVASNPSRGYYHRTEG